MHATEEGDELGAVLKGSVAGKLNLAAKVIAANSKRAGRTSEDRKAVGAADEVMRTKSESPSVAVVKSNATNLVVVGCELREQRPVGELRLGGREWLRGNEGRKVAPHCRLRCACAVNNHPRDDDGRKCEEAEDGGCQFHETRATPNY